MKRRPFDEVLADYAAETGQPLMKRRRRIEPVPEAPDADVFDLAELRRLWGHDTSVEASKAHHPTGRKPA